MIQSCRYLYKDPVPSRGYVAIVILPNPAAVRRCPSASSLFIKSARSEGLVHTALIVLAGRVWGIGADCVALGVKQDGQCGLATAMGNLFGLIGGTAFFLVGMIALWISWIRLKQMQRDGVEMGET